MPMKRRVALFINDMNSIGGIQRVAANLARDLQAWYEVVLITMFSSTRTLFDHPGVRVETLGLPYYPGRFYPLYREMPVIGNRLRKVVRDQGIDSVICFWFHLASIAAVCLPRRVRTIGYEHIAFSGATGRWARIREWAYPRLDVVVSLTEQDRAQFSKLAKAVEVIPNYVRVPGAGNVTRQRILLTVGHIEHRKGIDRLLWALKEPLAAHRDWKLVIVGGGEVGHVEHWYLSYIHDLAGLLGISRQVELHPGTDRIGDWYERASVYVMGSRLEGFPMVLLEAKAHGLPVISYDCPTGPREIIRGGVDGFLIRGDHMEYAAAARQLMTDPLLRLRMGAAAVDDVTARFSPDRICRSWCNVIDGVLVSAPA